MRILIAEDDPVSRRLLEVTLKKWGYDVVVCNDGREAWDALKQEDSPRLAILDWMMPQMDGLEVCTRVRELTRQEYTYIIMLTAKGRKEDIIDGMTAGADDYITKPFNQGELQVRLRAATRVLELQSQLLAAQEELRHQATHDALTGLYNRSAVLDNLSREAARAIREHTSLAVLMIDLDKFKSINDTYGHQAGDTVLKEAASRIRNAIRPYDGFGRYGGEEFLLVLPRCDSTFAKYVAERLRACVASNPFVLDDDSEVQVTVSVGVASKIVEGGSDGEELIQHADAALYVAKRSGRDRVEVAELVGEVAG